MDRLHISRLDRGSRDGTPGQPSRDDQRHKALDSNGLNVVGRVSRNGPDDRDGPIPTLSSDRAEGFAETDDDREVVEI